MKPLLLIPLAIAGGASCASPAAEETSVAAGQRAFQKCYACHALDAGKNLSGPSLYRIVGRRVADGPGFDYSPALRQFAAAHPVWTPELLDRFIADPEALVPGTTMAFVGMRDERERAALIGYLSQASETGR